MTVRIKKKVAKIQEKKNGKHCNPLYFYEVRFEYF